MDAASLKKAMQTISNVMTEQKEYLIELDQKNGDGDLGISMSDGFKAASDALGQSEESDLGRLFLKASAAFNEAAPSSLGTILSLGMMGMAKMLKGKTEVELAGFAEAMKAGIGRIMEKAGSKPGEKTILDALCPAVDALFANSDDKEKAFHAAAQAAAKGSESTREMRSVHGRAAYYGDKSIGVLDGGSVVGKLLFEAIEQSHCR